VIGIEVVVVVLSAGVEVVVLIGVVVVVVAVIVVGDAVVVVVEELDGDEVGEDDDGGGFVGVVLVCVRGRMSARDGRVFKLPQVQRSALSAQKCSAHMLCLWMGQGFKIKDRGGMYMLRSAGCVDGMV
jgi:hypothetical protein